MYSQLGAAVEAGVGSYEKDYISSDEDEAAAEKWEPVPLQDSESFSKTANELISTRRRQMDTISTLVNIYGSPKEFIQVYQQMLESRLLLDSNYDYKREFSNVELMKQRFGEKSMHSCDVMLKDIRDSERINKEVKQL